MADPITLEQVQGALNPEQRAFLDAHIQTTSQAAVDKFKTDAEEARKKAIPETYQLKFSDNVRLDPKADAEKIGAHLEEAGFTNEQAAMHVKHLEEMASTIALRTEQAHEQKLAAEGDQRLKEMGEAMKTQLAAHPRIGGARLPEARANAERALQWVTQRSPGLKEAVEELKIDIGQTIYSDYAPLIEIFAEFGKAVREPDIIRGSASGDKGPRDLKEALYGRKTG